MGKFIQTNTPRDKLECPSCLYQFYIFRHKKKHIVCPKCEWDHSFNYPDEEE